MMRLWDMGTIDIQEEMYLVMFDAKLKMISHKALFAGGMTEVKPDLKILLAAAITSGAHSIAIVHNHPSGDPAPSLSDVGFTNKLIKACALLDIELVDHMIITSERYFSFKDERLIR